MSEFPYALDLGHDHYLAWVVKGEYDDTPVGATIEHKTPDGSWCMCGVRWANSAYEDEHGGSARNAWKVESPAIDEHLTLSPSILCPCGDHGFIRDGKWVPA